MSQKSDSTGLEQFTSETLEACNPLWPCCLSDATAPPLMMMMMMDDKWIKINDDNHGNSNNDWYNVITCLLGK